MLLAPARLQSAKEGLYLRVATFASSFGILSAFRATQAGDQLSNLLIANAA